MAVTMGNAIRQLKLEISDSDIDMPEQDVCIILGDFSSSNGVCLFNLGKGSAM